MRVVGLAALPDAALVVDAGYMGAPTVGLEKLDSDQAQAAAQAVLQAYRAAAAAPPGNSSSRGSSEASDGSAGARLAAVMAGEVGGGNGVEPLVVGARLGLPVLDADLMGRAFPELQARGGRWAARQPAQTRLETAITIPPVPILSRCTFLLYR